MVVIGRHLELDLGQALCVLNLVAGFKLRLSPELVPVAAALHGVFLGSPISEEQVLADQSGESAKFELVIKVPENVSDEEVVRIVSESVTRMIRLIGYLVVAVSKFGLSRFIQCLQFPPEYGSAAPKMYA